MVHAWAENTKGVLLIDTQGQWSWNELEQTLDDAAVMLIQASAPAVCALALRDIQLAPGFTKATHKLSSLKIGALVVWGETLDSWFALEIIREVVTLPYPLYPVRNLIDLIPCSVTILNAVLPTLG
jgi:hypothetical protein